MAPGYNELISYIDCHGKGNTVVTPMDVAFWLGDIRLVGVLAVKASHEDNILTRRKDTIRLPIDPFQLAR